jgi:hypothetical protein
MHHGEKMRNKVLTIQLVVNVIDYEILKEKVINLYDGIPIKTIQNYITQKN